MSTLIIDLGQGNLGSVARAFEHAGDKPIISNSRFEIENADRLVFPGVGAFDTAMIAVDELGLRKAICDKVLAEKVPTLGICLGMHLFTSRSDEGVLPGFGWLPGEVVSLKSKKNKMRLPVPHMGWNDIKATGYAGWIPDFELSSRYYFMHSLYVRGTDSEMIAATTSYIETIPSILIRENIVGVQFHPEKSHSAGLALLSCFLEMERQC